MDIYVFVVQMRWIAGREVVLDLVTLTFDSSPIKGEGIRLVLACCLPHRLDSRLRGNDGRFCKGLHQGRGGIWVVLAYSPSPRPVD